jgi:integrase
MCCYETHDESPDPDIPGHRDRTRWQLQSRDGKALVKVRLTKRFVEDLTNPETELFLWDESLPGFGLRVSPSGAKAYQLQYRDGDGKSHRITLGRYSVIGLGEARRIAQERMATVLLGEAPVKKMPAVQTEPTFSQLADRYLREHAEVYKKSRSAREDGRLLTKVILPVLGSEPVSGITRKDLASLHYSLVNTPVQANRVLALLSKIFNLAEVWELRSDGTNPCRHLRKYPERGRQRYLSTPELIRLGEVLSAAETGGTESPQTILAIRLILLTGARHGEVLTLRWDDVNIERGTLTLPDSKTGRKEIVLAAPAVKLLEGASRKSASPWLVPGRNPAKHLSSLGAPWERLRLSAGIPDVHIHDLRHTFASTAVGLGLGLPILGGLLGHTQMATTQRYAHLDLDPRREAAEAIAGQLDLLLRSGQGSVQAALGA